MNEREEHEQRVAKIRKLLEDFDTRYEEAMFDIQSLRDLEDHHTLVEAQRKLQECRLWLDAWNEMTFSYLT